MREIDAKDMSLLAYLFLNGSDRISWTERGRTVGGGLGCAPATRISQQKPSLLIKSAIFFNDTALILGKIDGAWYQTHHRAGVSNPRHDVCMSHKVIRHHIFVAWFPGVP